MLSSRISNQAWPSSSATKTAEPLRTLTRKLVMLSKRRNLPPVPIMATMDNLSAQIIGATIIINLRNTLSTTTTVTFKLRTELKITLKVKEPAYIKFLIPLPIPTMIFTSLNPLLLNLNIVKIIYYVTLFFFVDLVISYF